MKNIILKSSINWNDLTPHLYSWEEFYPEWGKPVRCAAYFPEKEVILIDPMLPSGKKRKTYWEILDHFIIEKGMPLHILLTVFWHLRSSKVLLRRYKGKVNLWCPAEGRKKLSVPAIRFKPGDKLPAGIRAFPSVRDYEAVLWINRIKTLFFGDVIHGQKNQKLKFCPRSWLPKGTTHAEFAKTLKPLIKLPVEIVNVGHGDPVTENASQSLKNVIKSKL